MKLLLAILDQWIQKTISEMMEKIVTFDAAFVLTACAPSQPQWSKEGSDAAEFKRVSEQCKVKSDSQFQTLLQQVLISYANCMQSHGWRQP